MSVITRYAKPAIIILVCCGVSFYAGWKAPAMFGSMFKHEAPAPVPPKFYPLEKIVISLQGKEYQHYALFEMALQSTTADATHILAQAEPLIRNTLIQMFSGKTVKEVDGPENLDKLQHEACKLLNKVLKKDNFHVAIDKVLFTRLVVQ
ncbi:hypothetical protein NFHSH190041_01550 [Shewanella sp. NFH-SH190041]|uniref:flagellar basal body-associated FliL family protein n=1 Tax=Shewanella sp. NFH-SH190041 TaxID=2950245 RepID=UPI0021C37FFF|nr:flagellar basal body-associated FliL family protein [Shewanella sp. NFH-SH190041]BDM62703.1 hypothetical protein NFHSH190041_01550 [Shewanella sp. NFH-SH190041]